MFNVQGFYRSKGTLSNFTSRTDWNLPGLSGTLRVNTSGETLRNLPAGKLEENPPYLFRRKKNATPRSPTSSFSNSPIPLEPSNCTPEPSEAFATLHCNHSKSGRYLLQSSKNRQPGSSCMVHDFNVNLESISYGRN